jgi:DNA-binding response OmpR family regulator
MTARSILLVDDDEDLRETLIEQLSLYEEFAILQEASATKGIQTARNNHIDLLIMDVGLPDMDGREAVKLLRKGGFKAPIIMLTGHDTDSDTILGLEAGANDYVTKPFRFAVLLARIRAQLRQHEQSEDATFTVGPYTFKPSQKLLLDDKGGKIRLTEKEAAIIRYLYRADQKVVTRDVLLEEVWGYNSGVTTHTWKPMSTGFARRSRPIRPMPRSWSPKAAATRSFREAGRPGTRHAETETRSLFVALNDDIDLLSSVSLFSDIGEDKLRLIAFGAERRKLQAGQMLFRENTPADCAFVVADGSIELSRSTRHGQSETIGTARRGTLLGELAMVTAVDRSMTAIALDAAEVIRINRPLFRRMLEEYPEIAGIVRERISANLAELNNGLSKIADRFAGA